MRIALYKGKSLISRLIRWQTRSQYSHAAFLLDDGSVIEMWTGGAREIIPLPYQNHICALSKQHTPGTPVDICRFICPLTKEENGRLERLARADVIAQIKYDYLGILCFLTRQKDPNRGKLFCSEQVFLHCKQIGRPLLERTEAWRVPPDWIGRSPHLEYQRSIVTV